MKQVEKLFEDIEKLFESSDYNTIFTELLGWDHPSSRPSVIKTASTSHSIIPVATLCGFNVLEISSEEEPARPILQEIEKHLAKISPEHIVIYKYQDMHKWRWPRMSSSTSSSFEIIEFNADSLPLYLIQRLASLKVDRDFRSRATLAQVRDLVAGQFDSDKVTKKFYDAFKKQHELLSQSIRGIDHEPQRNEYASLILNRLMFMYFFEKKGFLNNDLNYLRTCLNELTKLQGQNRFYNFYRDLLQPIFFEGLNSRMRPITNELAEIIGDIPYVNGGIFAEHALESDPSLLVPDDAFLSVFDFFDSFTWHLDTRSGGNHDEINPDVLGYIFEQYINFTSSGRREGGAYYTPTDVSSYMATQSISPHFLDLLHSLGVQYRDKLKATPHRYLPSQLLHGYDYESRMWRQTPPGISTSFADDPLNWASLDQAETTSDVCLPGESWVETCHRRDRADSLVQLLLSNMDITPDDFVTHGLNGLLLIQDLLEEGLEENQKDLFWNALSRFSLLDPTCGSGAFLFSALEVLECIYQSFLSGSRRAPILTSITSAELEHLMTHSNRRYAIRKHIALHNLFGNDLMPEGIETAKLRIYLSLVACLQNRSELEPLPDLDFNLKTGNLLFGLIKAEDIESIGGDLYSIDQLEALKPRVQEFAKEYGKFISASAEGSVTRKQKVDLEKKLNEIRMEVNSVYTACLRVDEKYSSTWIEKNKPLHWFIEFPRVLTNGGFDVIVGNPPYVRRTELAKDYLEALTFLRTNKAPDIYAMCFERSLQLLSMKGRHAFIVMLSLAFSDKYAELRYLFSDLGFNEWWSTYGKRPDSLFAGIQVRNTVILLSPGGKKFASHHQLFSTKSRESLFGCLEYQAITRKGVEIPARAGLVNELLYRSEVKPTPKVTVSNLRYRPTGSYWFPVLPSTPPILKFPELSSSGTLDSQTKEVQVPEGMPESILLAALGGKLGYLFWSALEDDFHCTDRTVLAVGALLSNLENTSVERLLKSSEMIRESVCNAVFVSNNANAGYINVRWNALRSVTDEFDKLLLEELHLGHLWRGLNIWYRQVMKSSRENSNSINLTSEQVKQFVDW